MQKRARSECHKEINEKVRCGSETKQLIKGGYSTRVGT
jgi:hypothetical protein